MLMAPKVSVIIPIYNAEHYLKKCLDSLLDQSLRDIDIICIDDGSTDDSWRILEQYSASEPRLRAVTQSNAGAGAARNRGLELATGEYISFLDADDWFHPDMLKLTYERATATDADICIFQATQFDETSGKTKPITWGFKTEWIPAKEPFSHADASKHFFQCFMGWAWDKLFKRSFLLENKLCFPAIHNSEDMTFVFSSLALASRISTLRQPLLTQRTGNSQSLSNSRTLHSLCFYKSLLTLKQNLLDADIFIPLRTSFANWALEYTRWNLSTLQPEEQTKACQFLREEGLFQLGIADMAWRDAYNKRQFNQLRSLLAELPEKGIGKKIFPWTRKLGDLIKRPTLSIIIPVYNVENYLRTCLDSILNQKNLQDYEIICINNGSTDQSGAILEEYKDKLPNLKILFEEHRSFSPCRNIALDKARGVYIGFLDSDDYAEHDMFSSMLAIAENTGCDIVMCQTFVEREAEYEDEERVRLTEQYVYCKYKGRKSCRKKFYNNINCCIWNKIYKRSLLEKNHIRFPEPLLYEDNVFYRNIIIHAKSIYFLPRKLYHYTIRASSVMGRFHHKSSEKSALDHINICRIAHRQLVQYGKWEQWNQEYFRFLQLQIFHASSGFPDDIQAHVIRETQSLLSNINYSQYSSIPKLTRKTFDQIISCSDYHPLSWDWTSLKK